MRKPPVSSDQPSSRLPATAIDRRALLRGLGLGVPALSVAGAVLLRSAPALAAPRIGEPAPDFALADTNGSMRSLSEMRGKIVILEWSNAECPYVRKHYGASNMQTLQREATETGAIWLTVISSAPGAQGHVSPEEANRLTASRDASPSGVLLDPEGTLGRSYGAKTTPHMYVIDADGVLRYMGGIDSIASTRVADLEKAQPYFWEAFLAVAGGQQVENAVTRPYGCSIKYAS